MQAIRQAPGISQAVPGDFDSAVLVHQGRVYAYIARVVGAGPDAEDLTQEVFVKAYLGRTRFRGDASTLTWLFRIATNLIIDRRRSASRRSRGRVRADVAELADEWPDPDPGANPLAQAARAELRLAVRSALESLPLKMRTCVVLFDLEGLSYEEVGAIAGCPVGTVKSRLHHGRAMLRHRLERYVEGPNP
jgi:RNA polymerase sigma-70 factor (ECF subfamily)